MTPRKVPYPIPAVEAVADPMIREALIAIRADIETLYGVKGQRDAAAITRADMIGMGFLTYDDAGNLIGRNIRQKPGLSTPREKSIRDDSAVWISTVLDATDGLAAGAHTLDTILPANAFVIQSWYEVLTGFTGAIGSTIGVGIETDDTNGIVAPTVLISGWAATGAKAGIQDGAIANFTAKTTAERPIEANITGSLTSGRARIHLQYIVSE